ncbi:hypothetical protein V6N11_006796 [Hibiscus sabdariffa]|uniref:TF-B3 domain-containing protein n=1 Tax=Hibiscus sabdariffa TaxID=183260 RepID=A0ABR2RRW2_9ROSI
MENQGQGGDRITSRLTQSEVEQQVLLLPFVALSAYFVFEKGQFFVMDVKDSLGKDWTFFGTFHANEDLGNYVMIRLSQFPVEKGLKPNDEVSIMELPRQDGEGPCRKFKIEIKRQIRLFGVDIWGDLNV